MSFQVLALYALAFSAVCINALVTLNQPSSMSTSSGQNVQISCIMTGSNLDSTYFSWYQQIHGAVPRFLFYYSSGSSIYRGSGVSDRFSGSVSGNTATLTIANVQSGDAAEYYWAVWKDAYIFGKGTRLSIGTPRAPAVSVLRPSEEEITGKGTATLVCLVSGFNPGAVNIEWTVDGSARSDGVETSRIQQEKDNTFSASSYLTLPATVWNSHELYSCVVKHETQAIPLKADIARSGSPRAPAVSVLPPSPEEITGTGTATLVCLVSGFNPGAVNIEGIVDVSARSDGVETSRIQQEKDNTFSASSYLTLPTTVWKSHELYSCVVKHENPGKPA